MNEQGDLRAVVEETIDTGATSVEEVHQKIADMPFSLLERIQPLGERAEELRDLEHKTIGIVYDAIRSMNHSVSEIAREILATRASSSSAAAEK